MMYVFPSLVPSYRWHKRYRDVSVGDIGLIKEDSSIRRDYRYARVSEVKLGVDNHVRIVTQTIATWKIAAIGK